MNLIKLDATASTNTYLRELSNSCDLDNFTVVVAENQFAGKGQRGTLWSTEIGNNLTFSVFVKDFLPSAEFVFDLNILVALSIYKALKNNFELTFYIKWPNDILAENKKVGGVLIENMLKASGSVHSIIGIGINVNQENFEFLPQGSSLAKLLGEKIDKELVLELILEELKTHLTDFSINKMNTYWEEYRLALFRKDVVSAFEHVDGKRFSGIIRTVTKYGMLQVEAEDNELYEYALKEIKLLY
ncbi:MAG: biotin--[acetyl-CoA-carboxylase] ligase [Flavobacteriaceae bacterium]|jgi:BirA family biotin operon repressor/biotin-[acetyl-CoA-carboxylase] ligase|nr:biotin--[acetyl-CoA-carboxylase] ligase [Flavobacteriaceae bacterium]